MTSERKIQANRRNAQRSTGPRSRKGKRRVSKNALRGLATRILDDPEKLAQVEQLVRALAPEGRPDRLQLARIVAEAELEVIRVRTARRNLLHLEKVRAFPAHLRMDIRQESSHEPVGMLADQVHPVSLDSEYKARALLWALPQLARLELLP
jgi:hypothetical protein